MNDKKLKAFGIFSLKGGVGKTTIAHAFTTGLVKKGHSVAFLDADYSNPVAHLLFDIPHQRHKPLADFGIEPIQLQGLQFGSVGFLFSSTGASKQSSAYRSQVISDLCSSLRWQPFEHIVIDMAPSSTEENKTVLKALDPAVIIVTEKGPLAERGLERTIKFLTASRALVLGVVGNKGFDAQLLAKAHGVQYLGTLSFDDELTLDPELFLKSTPKRLGQVSLKQKGKRRLLRTGLETYVKVREWQG